LSNSYYNHSTFPATGALGASSAMRTELDSVAAGFAKLPTLSGGASKIIAVASDESGLEAITTTGTGSGVRATSPTLVTPILGTPTSGTLTNCTGFPLANLSGAAAGVLTFLATPSSANLITAVTDETGSGALVFATSPTLVTPLLGTPTSGTLTNCTGYPVANLANLGSNVATFLATPSSANLRSALTDETGTGAAVFADTPTLVTPILGTPTSGTLTNCTGYTVANLSGAATGVLTFLQTPTSANLLAAVTNETGTGALVFADTPTLVTPVLGVATATSINKVAITAPASSATLTIANGKTLTASNTLTFTGTDSSSVAFGGGGTVAYLDPFGPVASSDFTTTSTTLVDVTGMSVALAANSTYLVAASISFRSTTTAGAKFALQYSVAGGAVEAGMLSQGATGTLVSSRISALASASAAVALTADTDMTAIITGRVTTGANAGNLTVQGLKVTSGTLTVYIGSVLSVTKVA
jgi:hypothetical protein